MMFENHRTFKTQFAGRELIVETGKTCMLSNGSCWVRYGDTVVMANVTMSAKPREGIDFFPLSVDYEERLYAVGKIPGSFLKREGRPSERSILTSRMVDRPIRPLFPKDMRNDVSVVMTVLSTDMDNQPEITGLIATSVALSISDIPWNGPIGGVNVGLVDDEIIINPNLEQRNKSDLTLTVAGTEEKIVMIEAGANEVSDERMLDAIAAGHEEIKKIVAFIRDVQKEIGKEKIVFESKKVNPELFEAIKEFAADRIKVALDTDDKNVREERLAPIVADIHEKFEELYPEDAGTIDECIYLVQKYIVRRWLLDEQKRVDGRGMNEIRPLAAEVAVVPRVHGSGLFTRGQTQVLSIATLGPMRDSQIIDGIDEEDEKRYMHHYNFPSYSVGETKPSRGPGRREIGHGALAEKALVPVLPSVEDFPYAIRVVSEVLSSNGSTSQGSICGSTLALMDAGVPIKAPVAGVAMGLIKDAHSDKVAVLTDIQGLEDFLGDMDFKVAGTMNGITAIQMDIKIKGIDEAILRQALSQALDGRLFILGKMLEVLPQPREHLSAYAPKIIRFTINPDKIREVIGPGGKMINKIIDETGVKIDIDDDGSVYIATPDEAAAAKARRIIEGIAKDIEVGEVYTGKVVRMMNFGVFVELLPGKDGMVHISKLAKGRVEKCEDVVKIGDELEVKVAEIDSQGRINLVRNDIEYDNAEMPRRSAPGQRPPRRDANRR